jgi:pimeloyl-ACP methyl ester carboxylesterase
MMKSVHGIACRWRAILTFAACTAICVLPAASATRPPMTPAALDRYDAQKKTIVLTNGQAMAYMDIGRHDAPVLLLIHGYTDSTRDWAPLAPLLTPQFRLIIVDLRGHGASAKPECCYTRFDFAYDIELLLRKLAIPQADIAGHSLGSLVAQTVAEVWPERLRRLILISSTGTAFGTAEAPIENWNLDLAKLTDPIDPDTAFMRGWWHESTSINPEFFVSRQRRDAAAIPARIWRAIMDQSLIGVDLRFMLPRVRAPTLLIWGARDTLVDAAAKNALHTGIAGSELKIFDSLGHDLFWEDPQAVADVMIQFLAGKP